MQSASSQFQAPRRSLTAVMSSNTRTDGNASRGHCAERNIREILGDWKHDYLRRQVGEVELGTLESAQGALTTIFGNATYLDSSVDYKNVEEVSSNSWRAWIQS